MGEFQQAAIARERGFRDWERLRQFVEEFAPNPYELVAEFIDGAVSDLAAAERLLAVHPGIAGGGFYVDLVLGNARGVREFLAEFPEAAQGASGPQQCEPLLYVCFSRYARGGSGRAGNLLETARVLLERGANPNAVFIPEGQTEIQLSCLYAATGLNNNPGLGLALLEAGANPNDGESLYHSTEHPDLVCVRLLLEHGATVAGSNALNHMLDREDLAGVQLLLAAGADFGELTARGETSLHWAVWRKRGAAIVAALLDAGAPIDARRHDGRTAYAIAVQTGQAVVAELLRRRGADTALSPLDEFLAKCAAASSAELDGLLPGAALPAVPADGGRLLTDLTGARSVGAVRGLLAMGVPVGARGEHGASALHWACWNGFPELVKILLGAGASVTMEDQQYQGTPAGWTCHGLRFHEGAAGDYAEVARLLLGAGAVFAAGDVPTGTAEVDAVLGEFGVV